MKQVTEEAFIYSYILHLIFIWQRLVWQRLDWHGLIQNIYIIDTLYRYPIYIPFEIYFPCILTSLPYLLAGSV